MHRGSVGSALSVSSCRAVTCAIMRSTLPRSLQTLSKTSVRASSSSSKGVSRPLASWHVIRYEVCIEITALVHFMYGYTPLPRQCICLCNSLSRGSTLDRGSLRTVLRTRESSVRWSTLLSNRGSLLCSPCSSS
uniref:Uncharacterized protein n=1 Tax=Ixodes ricinus TaxID=34613 RepID=A0A6B0UT69_IXORI